MTNIVPVDEFVTDEWYPGYKPGYHHTHWFVEPQDTFSKADEERFWFLDFHWPRGLTPMGTINNDDCYCWGTQFAAETLPLPPGRGVTGRMAGTHLYGSAIAVTNPVEIGLRAQRIERNLPPFIQNFDAIWAGMSDEIEGWWNHFRGIDLSQLSLAELGANLVDARRYHMRAFEMHFQVMYPLLANFLGFYGACAEMGIDPAETGKFLQGEDTRIMETDRELSKLATAARASGLESVFASTEPEKLRAALSAHGGEASVWLTRFDDFLQVYGWRTEGSCDIALASWIEDPTPALGTIKTFLLRETEHDFEAARAASVAERDAAVEAARSGLTAEEQAVFDGGLASCRAANFPWWQDDHNFTIDLRITLPMRWATQAIAERVGADAKDDTLYLFYPEILDVAFGNASYDSFRTIIEARRQYFDHWYERRVTMPKVLGTIPESVQDPILIEIFGLNAHTLKVFETAGEVAERKTLTGVAASKGTARGIARVLTNSDELHRLQPGEILVCESTSPNWTPAFAKIAACVCDGGGTLSHAAIVGREYGIPTVTAVGLATVAIADGAEIEVDGTTGTVTILS